ncbi:MAG: aldo/keto reductase, partial [Clostridia bacterium]|nr:aldo/keto reductase [Clostridia bacterium]
MQYVPFGTLGFDISRLGFGCMRLPTVTGEDGKASIDVPRAVKLIRAGIDGGINYVDTAYPYHGGQSELVVGEALKDGYRERVKLATKLPCWAVKTRQDMDKLLDEQLKKLQVPYVDFYLLHALGKDRWEKMKALGALEFLDSAVRDGRIKYPSFSFHDEYPVFEDIINSYDWVMAQIQYNYLDIHHQAGMKGIELAKKRGVSLVIMEPLRGGALATPSQDIQAIIDAHPEKRSAVEWAFRFVGDEPQIATILSGMSDEKQLEENLELFDRVKVKGLSDADHALIKALREGYQKRMPIGCTGCRYCMPCPHGVDIPAAFLGLNSICLDGAGKARFEYLRNVGLRGGNALPSACVGCGACERHC